jgi:hypothetical protein
MKKEVEKIDIITMDVPLFIRMLEYAKEDAKTDMDLHQATENVIKLSKKFDALNMDNYNDIVSLKQETNEQMSDCSGSYEGSISSNPIKRKINNIPNFNPKEQSIDEITGADSSGSISDVPLFGSSLKGGRKNPLKIDGEKSISKSRAVVDKKFPKWGGPGGKFIKIKDKCKKFPYCNQGDINAIESLRESINEISGKFGIPSSIVETLVLNEIKNK